MRRLLSGLVTDGKINWLAGRAGYTDPQPCISLTEKGLACLRTAVALERLRTARTDAWTIYASLVGATADAGEVGFAARHLLGDDQSHDVIDRRVAQAITRSVWRELRRRVNGLPSTPTITHVLAAPTAGTP